LENLISYYPTYSILDEIVNYNSYKEINLYLDLKNISQALYQEWAVQLIVESTIKSGKIDTSVFDAIISFLSFHKVYAVKRNIKVNFFIFFETGPSFYHLNISKKYKINRKVDNLYGLDKEKRDLFFSVLQKNHMLIEKVLNKVPNTKVIRMVNFEADVIPYYLQSRDLVKKDKSVAHIIYSNDHDMLQCIDDHCYIYSKTIKGKEIVKKGQVMNKYLKEEKLGFPDEWFPLALSVLGDTGDCVDIAKKGFGPKNLIKILEQLVSEIGGMEHVYNNVHSKLPIFDVSSTSEKNKKILDLIKVESSIIRNLKLTSFEVISKYLDNPEKTETLEKKNHIENIINTNTVVDLNTIIKALNKSGIYVDEEIFSNLYYGWSPN